MTQQMSKWCFGCARGLAAACAIWIGGCASHRTRPIGLPCGWKREIRRVSVLVPSGTEERSIVYYRNSVGMEFVLIPAGRFVMGEPSSQTAESDQEGPAAPVPPHPVWITKPFFMSTTEVTVSQFREFVLSTGYRPSSETSNSTVIWNRNRQQMDWDLLPGFHWKNPGFEQSEACPVVAGDWFDAFAFCAWLSTNEGRDYRLPTEAEWEYACRAGSKTPFYTGEKIATFQANFDAVFNRWAKAYPGRTLPVASFAPNAHGLHDMAGNVWEWCADWWAGDEYYQFRSPLRDPQGPSRGFSRILRGGSWGNSLEACRSGRGWANAPTHTCSDTGFRVVCSARPVIPWCARVISPEIELQIRLRCPDMEAGFLGKGF